jgi:hypothetical protein
MSSLISKSVVEIQINIHLAREKPDNTQDIPCNIHVAREKLARALRMATFC